MSTQNIVADSLSRWPMERLPTHPGKHFQLFKLKSLERDCRLPFDVDHLPALQEKDDRLAKAINTLGDKVNERFLSHDGVLYVRRGHDEPALLAVPQSILGQIIRAYHEGYEQFGVTKTWQALKTEIWAYKLHKRVRETSDGRSGSSLTRGRSSRPGVGGGHWKKLRVIDDSERGSFHASHLKRYQTDGVSLKITARKNKRNVREELNAQAQHEDESASSWTGAERNEVASSLWTDGAVGQTKVDHTPQRSEKFYALPELPLGLPSAEQLRQATGAIPKRVDNNKVTSAGFTRLQLGTKPIQHVIEQSRGTRKL
ncbi:hypothetical protein CBL_20031 [Carabus blaptoides fortunei]